MKYFISLIIILFSTGICSAQDRKDIQNNYVIAKTDTLNKHKENSGSDEYPTAISLSTGLGRGWLNANGTNVNFNYALDINISLNSVIHNFYFNTGIQYSHQSKNTDLHYANQFKGALLYFLPSAGFHAFKNRATFFGGIGFSTLVSSSVMSYALIFSAKGQYNINDLFSIGLHIYNLELSKYPDGSKSRSWTNSNIYLSLNL